MQEEDIIGQGEEADDEWFYESIKRYDDLLMFDVHGGIGCAAFYDTAKVLLGVSRDSLNELLLLSVPDKLLAGRGAGLVKNRDFNLVAAGYTRGCVRKAEKVGNSVVVVEEGGIHLYSVPDTNNSSDVIKCSRTLELGLDGEVALAVCGSEHVYAGDTLSNLTLYNLNTRTTHKPLAFGSATNDNTKNEEISEVKCISDKVFICLRSKGSVLVCDRRTDSLVQRIQARTNTSGLWTIDANEHHVALADSSGNTSVYDVRSTSTDQIYSQNDRHWHNSSAQKVTVRLSPYNSFLSLSGLGNTVEVWNYSSESSDRQVFCHDGHRGEGVKGIVTHMWHPTQERLLLSADNTGKLNAWRFKVSKNA